MMNKISSVISSIRNTIKASVDDAFITDREIYSSVLKFAKALIRRQDNENKLMQYDSLFETVPYVELIEVDAIEADCAGIRTGCKFLRTRFQLPKVFSGSMGPIFRTISPIDFSKRLQQITPVMYVSISNSSNFKYNKTVYYWYKNGFLYIPARDGIEWEAIAIEAMWEDPINIECCGERNKKCFTMQNQPFNIPEYVRAELEQMVLQEFLTRAKLPEDTTDDTTNILR